MFIEWCLASGEKNVVRSIMITYHHHTITHAQFHTVHSIYGVMCNSLNNYYCYYCSHWDICARISFLLRKWSDIISPELKEWMSRGMWPWFEMMCVIIYRFTTGFEQTFSIYSNKSIFNVDFSRNCSFICIHSTIRWFKVLWKPNFEGEEQTLDNNTEQ